MGPGDRKLLLGTVLNRFPSIRREYVAQVRSGIHKLRMGLVSGNSLRPYIDSLEGKISHIATLSPTKGQKLLLDLTSARELCASPDRQSSPNAAH